jgi:hypothetical protein
MTAVAPSARAANTAPSAMSPSAMSLGCWTILDEGTDTVRAVVTGERGGYAVRNARGRLLGRYPTVQQALLSITG